MPKTIAVRPDRQGLQFEPVFCPTGEDPYARREWGERTASVHDASGQVLWEQAGCRFPADFDQMSVDVIASKFFYGSIKAAPNTPVADGGREHSLAELVDRVVGTITYWGARDGLFADDDSAVAFRNDLTELMFSGAACFNSPVLFNVGLYDRYGVRGTAETWRWDGGVGGGVTATKPGESYEYPQASACFIISMADTMESILQRAVTEGTIFKFGSGVGADNSTLRSSRETLSGGGRPSGPVSFMRIYDGVASTVKSGGKTRRAAKMEVLRCDHPDVMEFIEAKPRSERMAHTLIDGGWPADFNSVVYSSLPFQSSNLSVRVSNDFMAMATREGADGNPDLPDWQTLAVTTGRAADSAGHLMPAYNARAMLRAIADGAWLCGDPGLQYDDTIQRWHTCPASGRINASNPCVEYMFLDDTACNLASVNLMKFRRDDGAIDADRLVAAVKLMITAMEILVDHAGYPTRMIAQRSHDFRPLGLGFANLGALLMADGLPYDSDAGRSLAGAIMATIQGAAYRQSAALAAARGPFAGFEDNRLPMLNVVAMHGDHCDRGRVAAAAAHDAGAGPGYSQLRATYVLWERARLELQAAYADGCQHGYRNSQVTVIAPTGTIAFFMGCDTTGIEPDLALVKYKKLAGGGQMKIVNQTVPLALQTLGYDDQDVAEIVAHIAAYDTIEGCGVLLDRHLAVFDCSFPPADHPQLLAEGVTIAGRSIATAGHIGMMAAVQPFVSGAISKTINMPETATVEEIMAAYVAGWKGGLKALAIYRNNCKRSQPLSTKSEAPAVVANGATNGDGHDLIEALLAPTAPPRRDKLPADVASMRHKFTVGGHKGYIHVGFFTDGRPGEVFVTMDKEGSTVAGLMDALATLTSVALQYGVPLADLVAKFAHVKFEPSGPTGDPDVPLAKSLVDYIFRKLGARYGEAPVELQEAAPIRVRLTTDRIAPIAPATSQRPSSGLDQIVVGGGATQMFARATQTAQLSRFQGDAPACDVCGNIMVRSGSCYRCLECGAQGGCG